MKIFLSEFPRESAKSDEKLRGARVAGQQDVPRLPRGRERGPPWEMWPVFLPPVLGPGSGTTRTWAPQLKGATGTSFRREAPLEEDPARTVEGAEPLWEGRQRFTPDQVVDTGCR